MSLKKILAVVMACAMICGAFAASALTLDVAESANETVVAEEAVLAAETVEVDTVEELKAALNASSNILLTGDINLNNEEWTPVSYGGVFDGQNHTIKNLKINLPDTNNVGFITSVNSTFKNVTFENVDVVGRECVAAVAGRAGGSNSIVDNVTVKGTIKIESTNNGYARAGVIVGGWAYGQYKNIIVDGGSADTSYVKWTGTGDGRYCAGIIGHADDVDAFINCTVKNITIDGNWLCGGIAGPGPAASETSGCVVENVKIASTYSGGIFGWYYGNGTIDDCAVKNVEFTAGSSGNGVIGGYGMAENVAVTNTTIENVTNYNGASFAVSYAAEVSNDTGSVYYTSIEDAVAAATGEDVITLLADTSTDTKLHFVDHVTLDLNGKTLTTSKTMYADGGALVNIISSADDKGIISYTEPYEAIYVRGAINKLENVKIDGNNVANYGIYIYGQGRYVKEINNCEIVNVKNGLGTYKVNNTENYPAFGAITGTTIGASDIGIFFFRGGMVANLENSNVTGGRLGIAYWGHSADAGYVNSVTAKNSTITGTTGTAVEMLTEWHNTNNLVYEMNLDNCKLIGAKGAATIDYTAVADEDKAFVTADSGIVCYVDNEGMITYHTEVPEEYEGTLYKVVATVNDIDYYSFGGALNAADELNVPATIDLLGNTVSASEVTGIHLKNTITIENGTIDVTDVAEDGDAIISIGDRTATPDFTLNNVNVTGKNYSEAFGIFYIIPANGNAGTLTLNNCNFNLENNKTKSGGVIKSDGAVANVVINNCTFNLVNPTRIFNNVTVDIDNTTIVAETNENGIVNNAFRAVAGTITNSNITAIGFENGIKNKETGFNLVLDGTTVVKLIDCDKGVPAENELGYDIYLTANNAVTVKDEAKLYADTVYVEDGSKVNAADGAFVSVANIIKVVFEKVDGAAEGYDLYNINLVGANDEVINRLNSADLTFVLDATPFTGAAVNYEIIPVKNVTVTPDTTTPDEDRFMFNFKGKDLDVIEGADTAKVITIAQVKVTGYGKYEFSVDTSVEANKNNVVHATTISDNIVDTFVPGGATGKGTLDLDDATTGEVTIVVPVRTLTVNVTFPNTVDKNDALYQDMKVEITGNIEGVHQTVTHKLGEDEVAMLNDGYVVTEARLVLNETYNIVVTGAGYRTARYTVTMTDSKTVNFWNNVKDNDTVVEEGKHSEKLNFLAGDIVGDNNINIYDLSAVVSYFATSITDEADYETYVKYDLNRDHVIDSKDVAYVLVSWGK